MDAITGSIDEYLSGAMTLMVTWKSFQGKKTPLHHSLLDIPNTASVYLNSALWSLEGTYPANPVPELQFIPSLDTQQVVL